MAEALVTPEYVASSTGADIDTDPTRVDFLIVEASTMVCEYLGREYTAADVPVAIKQAVSIMVATVLGDSDASSPDIKAESIGDYRVEFIAGQYTSGLDIRQVDYLLDPLKSKARSVRTNVPMDGVSASGTVWDGLGLVINR